MHVIVGFLSFQDFINEIHHNAPVVRIQDYYLTATTDLGIEWTTHYVELGARQMSRSGSDEIYICRFRIGGGPTADQDRRVRDAENARRAAEALREHLGRKGFMVKPGLFAAAKETNVLASGPWHFENDEQGLPVLVPEFGEQ